MIGIDVISIKRFVKIGRNDYAHWSKFFSKDEWDYCFSQPDRPRSLAGVFAAKEAVMKALGKDLLERFDRISIHRDSDGKPIVFIDKHERTDVQASISHDAGIAAAVAIKYER